jgi:hypothetical protein
MQHKPLPAPRVDPALAMPQHGHPLWVHPTPLHLFTQDLRSRPEFVEGVDEGVEVDGQQPARADQLEGGERLCWIGVVAMHEVARLDGRDGQERSDRRRACLLQDAPPVGRLDPRTAPPTGRLETLGQAAGAQQCRPRQLGPVVAKVAEMRR